MAKVSDNTGKAPASSMINQAYGQHDALGLPSVAFLAEAVHPFRLHLFDSLGSTNDKAAEMRRSGDLYAPAIVMARQQTAGRGRSGNRWFSNQGSLTLTYVLPIEESLLPTQLPLIVGLAVRNAAAELTGHASIGLKWPNDVVVDGRKLAGVLCERINGVDLVGIGLNVNVNPSETPPDLRYGITSLNILSGSPLDMGHTLVTLTRHLRQLVLTRSSHLFATFVSQYRQFDALLGQTLQVASMGDPLIQGTCEGIDSDGRLLVRSNNGMLHRVIAGSVAWGSHLTPI